MLCVFYVHVTYESMSVCVGIIYVYIAVHMCAWMCWLLINYHTNPHSHTYTHIHTHTHALTYTPVSLQICSHTCIYTPTHPHTHTHHGRIQTLESGGANGVECECAEALCASAIQGGLGVLPHKYLDITYSKIDSDASWIVIPISELIKNNHMKIQV